MKLSILREILVEELGAMEEVDTDAKEAIVAALATMERHRVVALQTCEYCGMGFNRKGGGRFCSLQCYEDWRERQPSDTPNRGRYRGPTPDARVIYGDAFGEADGKKWAEYQIVDIQRRVWLAAMGLLPHAQLPLGRPPTEKGTWV